MPHSNCPPYFPPIPCPTAVNNKLLQFIYRNIYVLYEESKRLNSQEAAAGPTPASLREAAIARAKAERAASKR